MPDIIFHGAASTVTGSCTEIRIGDRSILIDCGLFQGPRTLEHRNAARFAFDPAGIAAVLLTHAHIDHSGLLPKLVREGYDGPIWCTRQTGDLLRVMLPDAGRIQEAEAARRNRRADRADEPPVAPVYLERDAIHAAALAKATELRTPFSPIEGVTARLWNAGHILGSASIEIEAEGCRLLFSGDIGPRDKSFYPSPSAPSGFDHVVCEATYGDRQRDRQTPEQRRSVLGEEARAALARGGNLIIPSFALERTQELLLDFAALIESGQLGPAHVFIDSPLASRITRIFAKYEHELEDVESRLFERSDFHFIETPGESIGLNSVSGAIILSASGMCEAGRIRHHLRHNLPRRDSTILFVGFQAAGTLGRTLLEGARRVRVSGTDVAVRARISRIESYSAHADQQDLLRWIDARRPIGGTLFLNHGEREALETLAQLAGVGHKEASISIAEPGERYRLAAGRPGTRLQVGDRALIKAAARDWQNDYADLVTNLKADLQALETDAARQLAIDRIRRALRGAPSG
ncbi:MAG: MBL fold metallo-hydrolase [Sphingomonas sp.]